MALDTPALKTGIENLLEELYTNGSGLTTAQAREKFANDLSGLIEDFVKSGDGKYQAGTLTAGATPVTNVGVSVAIKIT